MVEKFLDVEVPKHLGGHSRKTNVDRGAFQYLVDTFPIKTMLDIGCGPGGMIDLARSHGITAYGIDGDPSISHPNIQTYDFVCGPIELEDPKEFDLGWCVEFVEHLEACHIPNFLPALQACKLLVMTAAPPNAPGHHHVNCQPQSYWIDILTKAGFDYDEQESARLKLHSKMYKMEFYDQKEDVLEAMGWAKSFIVTTGMFFRRKK